MLHLLPIRILLTAFAVLIACFVLLTTYDGWFESPEFVGRLLSLGRLTSILTLIFIILLYCIWRWLSLVQRVIFPYLGGVWCGEVRFVDGNGNNDFRKVTLNVNHTLFGLKLLLESLETRSVTMAVQAEKGPFETFRLFYVYLNERKEGTQGAGSSYRGLAIVNFISANPPKLEGDYFTDTHRQGTLHLERIRQTSWWKLWK